MQESESEKLIDLEFRYQFLRCYQFSKSHNRYIPSGEAFFVESLDAVYPGTLTFKETDKNNSGSDLLFRPVYGNEKMRINLLAVNANGSASLSDGVLTTYDNNNANTVDKNDAKKLYNTAENICV